jgi:hypothetical protein
LQILQGLTLFDLIEPGTSVSEQIIVKLNWFDELKERAPTK